MRKKIIRPWKSPEFQTKPTAYYSVAFMRMLVFCTKFFLIAKSKGNINAIYIQHNTLTMKVMKEI